MQAVSEDDTYWVSAKGLLILWAGVLAGSVAWALHQQLVYVLVPIACRESTALLHAVSGVTLILAGAGAAVAWRAWNRAGAGPDTAGGRVGRSRFMAVSGFFMSGLFSLAIVAQWIPIFMVDPCH